MPLSGSRTQEGFKLIGTRQFIVCGAAVTEFGEKINIVNKNTGTVLCVTTEMYVKMKAEMVYVHISPLECGTES
jgi:vacuolar-type H+-ATPase subunit F/Vma7